MTCHFGVLHVTCHRIHQIQFQLILIFDRCVCIKINWIKSHFFHLISACSCQNEDWWELDLMSLVVWTRPLIDAGPHLGTFFDFLWITTPHYLPHKWLVLLPIWKRFSTPNRPDIGLSFGPKKFDCRLSKFCVMETQKTCKFYYEKEEVFWFEYIHNSIKF